MHLDNLIFLLLIAMAALFRLLVSKAGNREKSEPQERSTSTPRPSQPVARPPAETDEERIRRFLEALGQPTSSKPPAPAAPRTDLPPRPLAPVQPPSHFPLPIPTRAFRRVAPRTKTKEQSGSNPPSPIYAVTRRSPLQPTAEPIFEVQERATPAEAPPITAAASWVGTQSEIVTSGDGIDIATLVSTPSRLRNAIILREIFGPPRSLQSLDWMGIG